MTPARQQPLTLFILLTIISGCSSFSGDVQSFNQDMAQGNFDKAQKLAENRAGDNNRNTLLWQLQAGVAARQNMDFEESNRFFDLAENGIKNYEEQTLASNAGQGFSATLINDTTTPYTPKSYDAIMANSYKGLNYLALGKTDGARVEFNRAIDRQRRAREFFEREIQKEQEAIDARISKKRSAGFNVNRTMNNQGLNTSLHTRGSNIPAYKAYPDFINPYTTYIAGLFAILDQDLNKASQLLKQSSAMIPDNTFVAHDYSLVEQSLNTGKPFPPSVWIILENGRGPTLDEFRVDIPVFLVSDQVLYSGIALPSLQGGKAAVTSLDIRSGSQNLQTMELSNMEHVVHREFEKRYGAVVRRALLSALLKSSLQYVAQKKGGDLELIAATIFQLVSTRADTRIWTGLPHNFQLARLAKPQDKQLTIHSSSHAAMQIHLTDAPYTLIYVTISSYLSKPVIQVYSY